MLEVFWREVRAPDADEDAAIKAMRQKASDDFAIYGLVRTLNTLDELIRAAEGKKPA